MFGEVVYHVGVNEKIESKRFSLMCLPKSSSAGVRSASAHTLRTGLQHTAPMVNLKAHVWIVANNVRDVERFMAFGS